MSTAPGLERALENARQEADRRALALIDPAALLAGMLQVETAMSTRMLRDAGVDLRRLRALLRSSGN